MKVTREAHVAACVTRAAHGAQTTKSEKHDDQVSHGGVGPHSGRVSQKVSSKSADQVVVNYRTGAGPATTSKQSTTQQCWSDHPQATSL